MTHTHTRKCVNEIHTYACMHAHAHTHMYTHINKHNKCDIICIHDVHIITVTAYDEHAIYAKLKLIYNCKYLNSKTFIIKKGSRENYIPSCEIFNNTKVDKNSNITEKENSKILMFENLYHNENIGESISI